MPGLSIREQALVAFAAMLGTIDTIDGLTAARVTRNRAEPAALFPSLNVIDGDETPDHGHSNAATRYAAQLTVEGFVQGTTPALAGSALNALYAAVLAKIGNPSVNTLGGLVVDMTAGAYQSEIGRGENETPEAAFTLTVAFDYWTAAGDPYTAGP